MKLLRKYQSGGLPNKIIVNQMKDNIKGKSVGSAIRKVNRIFTSLPSLYLDYNLEYNADEEDNDDNYIDPDFLDEAYNKAESFANEYYRSSGFKERLSKLPQLSKSGLFDTSVYRNEFPRYFEDYRGRVRKDVKPDYSKPYNLVVTLYPLSVHPAGAGEDGGFAYGRDIYNKNVVRLPIKYPAKKIQDLTVPIAHEFGHAVDDALKVYANLNGAKGRTSNIYYSDLFPIFRLSRSYRSTINPGNGRSYAIERNDDSPIGHDAQPNESYADLFATRMMFKDAGIFDSTKAGLTFNQLHINRFKKEVINKDKNKGLKYRLFHNFTDDQIIWMMNNVAKNDTNVSSTEDNYYAKKGGKLIKKEYGRQ